MIASLHIRAALRDGKTYLKRSYFSPPLKLADITEDRRKKCLHLMQMSSSPGILDGDQFDIRIELEEGSHLQMHTQSYQRLFSMKIGARQSTEVFLEKNASLIFLPHPSVPQENSNFKVKNKIYLSPGCRLVWGEIVSCGRKLNGEIFRFSKYHAITEVYRDNKLKIKENICLIPAETNLFAIGQLEGFTHQASLIFVDDHNETASLIAEANEFLETQKGIMFGITTSSGTGILVRILGNKSEQLMDCLNTISKIFTEIKVAYGY